MKDVNMDYKTALLYATLISILDANSNEVHYSVNTLSEKTKLSKATILDKLKILQDIKALEIMKEDVGHGNYYKLNKCLFKIPKDFVDNVINNIFLEEREKAAFILLYNKFKKYNEEIYTLNITLTEMSNILKCDTRNAKKILEGLETKGFIIEVSKASGSTLYKFDLGRLNINNSNKNTIVNITLEDLKYLKDKIEELEIKLSTKIETLSDTITKHIKNHNHTLFS